MSRGVALKDVAEVVRSKNAGPYELTLDVIFKEKEDYEWAREVCFFTNERVANWYRIPVSAICSVIYFDPAWAVKITLLRPCVSGAVGDTDVYGAQQHAPLLDICIPLPRFLSQAP